MNIISMASNNMANQEKQQKTNQLISKCISYACQHTKDLRTVLAGDKLNKVICDKLEKVS